MADNRLNPVLIAALLCSVLLACAEGNSAAQGNAVGVDAAGEDLATCSPEAVGSWSTVGEPFMISWCRGCHSRDMPTGGRGGAPLDVNFDSRSDFDTRVVDIRDRVMEGTMPPTMVLRENELESFLKWISCGAP